MKKKRSRMYGARACVGVYTRCLIITKRERKSIDFSKHVVGSRNLTIIIIALRILRPVWEPGEEYEVLMCNIMKIL